MEKHAHVCDNNNLFSRAASGSAKYDAMVIIPCSMNTLSSISNGIGDAILTRAAFVILKENKIINHFTKAIVNPMSVTRVSTGPVHENIIEGPFELDKYFPIAITPFVVLLLQPRLKKVQTLIPRI